MGTDFQQRESLEYMRRCLSRVMISCLILNFDVEKIFWHFNFIELKVSTVTVVNQDGMRVE
jgi:hypothetical protein